MLVVRLLDESAAFLPPGTLESFRADLGLTYAQAGTVLAVAAPGAVVGTVFSVATDHFSRRLIAAGGAFALAASLAVFGSGRSFVMLAAASFVMGAAATAMVDAAEVALVDLAGDGLRPALARANFLGALGDLLGPALIAALAAAGCSWRAVFIAGAVLLALYGLVLAAAPIPRPPVVEAEPGQPEGARGGSARRRLAAVVRDPAVWFIGFIGFLIGPFDEPFVGFTVALLEQERGASPVAATLVAFVGVSGGLLAFTALARRFESVGDGRLLLGSAVAMAGAAIVVAVAPWLPAVAAAAFVVSVGLNLAWLAVQHRELTLRPGEVGTTKAVLGTIEFSGFWIPAAIGAVADHAGLAAAVGTYGLLGLALVGLASRAGRRSGADLPRGRHEVTRR